MATNCAKKGGANDKIIQAKEVLCRKVMEQAYKVKVNLEKREAQLWERYEKAQKAEQQRLLREAEEEARRRGHGNPAQMFSNQQTMHIASHCVLGTHKAEMAAKLAELSSSPNANSNVTYSYQYTFDKPIKGGCYQYDSASQKWQSANVRTVEFQYRVENGYWQEVGGHAVLGAQNRAAVTAAKAEVPKAPAVAEQAAKGMVERAAPEVSPQAAARAEQNFVTKAINEARETLQREAASTFDPETLPVSLSSEGEFLSANFSDPVEHKLQVTHQQELKKNYGVHLFCAEDPGLCHTLAKHGPDKQERFQFERAHGKKPDGVKRSNWASYWDSHDVLRRAREKVLSENFSKMVEFSKGWKPGDNNFLPFKVTLDEVLGHGMIKNGNGPNAEVKTFPDVHTATFGFVFENGVWYEATAFPNLRDHSEDLTAGQTPIEL